MLKINFKNSFSFLLLGIILLIHSVVLTKLIYFPYPELFIYPYLTNHGLKPYSQILDQHFPGLMFLPINLDNLGMTTPEAARIWSIGIIIVVQLMLFFIASRIFKSKTKALIVNILYLIWQPFFEGWVLWIDSFLPLLLLSAFYALYKKKLFIAGIFLGLSIVFKQTIIPLSLMILVYIFWTTHSKIMVARFLAGVFIPVSLMVLYFLSIGVFRDFWYWTVIFNLTTYAQSGRGEGPTLAHLSRALLVFGSAFLIVKKIRMSEVQLILIFLTGALIGLSTRFDFVHFQPALSFALIAFVFGLKEIRSQTWSGRLDAMIAAGYILVSAWWLVIFYKGHLGERIIAFDSDTKNIAVKIKQFTNPGEKIFVFGGQPHLYQMSETLPAGDIFVFQFPWFLKVAQDRILEGILKDKPNIIVSDKSVEVEGQKITEFAKEIDVYIQSNYQKIESIGTTDILQRSKIY